MISTSEFAKLLVADDHLGIDPALAEYIASHALDSVTFNASGESSRPLREVVEGLREAYPFAFRSRSLAATTTPSSTAPQYNPWRAESKNITMQVKIEVENPDLAKRLKAEAK